VLQPTLSQWRAWCLAPSELTPVNSARLQCHASINQHHHHHQQQQMTGCGAFSTMLLLMLLRSSKRLRREHGSLLQIRAIKFTQLHCHILFIFTIKSIK